LKRKKFLKFPNYAFIGLDTVVFKTLQGKALQKYAEAAHIRMNPGLPVEHSALGIGGVFPIDTSFFHGHNSCVMANIPCVGDKLLM